mgnify:CR=1 FL=1
MNIEEVQNTKPIKVSHFKFGCDSCDDSIPKPLPNTYNHMMIFTAKPRQGKTTLIYNLLTKQKKASPYYQKFDKIFIFSPSMKTIDKDPFENIPQEQKFDTLDFESLCNVYNTIEDCGERILLLVDDCVMDIAKNKQVEKLLTKMMMNRRHICGKSENDDGAGLSMWITTQVFNKLPRPLRACASHNIFFKTTNKRELETIFDEIILVSRKEFKQLLTYVFDKRFNFMFVDSEAIDPNKMYYKNFNLLKLSNVEGF